MAKIKIKKNRVSDMTAMCDVAFLCLPFVMTSTAKIPEALPVDTPLQQFRLNYLNLI
jgi:hypothetical protein